MLAQDKERSNLESLRIGLVDALTEARATLSSQGKPAGFKPLGSIIGTAPRRLSEICSEDFFLDFGPPESPKSEHAVGKTVLGFASSIYKVVEWLAQTLPPEVALVTLGPLHNRERDHGAARANIFALKDLLAEFWPKNYYDYAFWSTRCQKWIEQGFSAAQGEFSRASSLSIVVSVVEWGPFSTPVPGFVPRSIVCDVASVRNDVSRLSRAPVTDTPIVNYGASLLAAIDPIQFRPDLEGLFVTKALQDALTGLPSSRAGKWQVALGVYDSLYRQYEGYNFITLPIRTPIMAVEFHGRGNSSEKRSLHFGRADFSNLFAEHSSNHTDFEVFVIPRESGHLAIGRLVEARLIKEIDITKAEPSEIFDEIERRRDRKKKAYFVSDTILCFALYKALIEGDQLAGTKFLFQDRPSDFSFRTGFMLREEDQKLYRMMIAAQREVFRSPAKAINLIAHLAAATRAWVGEIHWPFPFFVIDAEGLDEMSRDDASREQIRSYLDGADDRYFEFEF